MKVAGLLAAVIREAEDIGCPIDITDVELYRWMHSMLRRKE